MVVIGSYAYGCTRAYSLAVLALAGVHRSFTYEGGSDGEGGEGKKFEWVEDPTAAWAVATKVLSGAACGCAVWAVASAAHQTRSRLAAPVIFGAGAAVAGACVGGAYRNIACPWALLAAVVAAQWTRRWHIPNDGAQALSARGLRWLLLLWVSLCGLLVGMIGWRCDAYVVEETAGRWHLRRVVREVAGQLWEHGFDKEAWRDWMEGLDSKSIDMTGKEAREVLELGDVGIDKITAADVRRAYRSLSRQWHPDKWHGDEAKHVEAEVMQTKLNLAKSVLMERLGLGADEL